MSAGNSNQDDSSKSVFTSASKQHILGNTDAMPIEVDNVEKNIEIEWFGNTYQVEYISSTKYFSELETNKINRVYHQYRDSTRKLAFYIDSETQKIIQISNSKSLPVASKGYTDDEIYSSAYEYLKYVVPEEYLSEYKPFENSVLDGMYFVKFSRYIHGYRLYSTTICLSCEDLQFVQFCTKYDVDVSSEYYENKFSKQDLDNAVTALRERIETDYPNYDKIYEPEVTVDCEGRLYVMFETTYSANDWPYGVEYFALVG